MRCERAGGGPIAGVLSGAIGRYFYSLVPRAAKSVPFCGAVAYKLTPKQSTRANCGWIATY